MEKKITLDGVECTMSSSVHQQTGAIFFHRDPKDETNYMAETFTEDETRKVVDALESKGWSANHSSSTYYPGYGRRVSLISVFMSEEAICDAFVDYFKKQSAL